MAIDAFLVIRPNPQNPPIGEAPTTDSYFLKTFPGATVISISDFEFAVENSAAIGSASGGAGGAGAGKAKFDELVIHKAIDRASPGLFSVCSSGRSFAAVQLYIRKATPGPGTTGVAAPFLAYEFQTVLITKIDWSGGGADPEPSEEVTFAYGALAIAYQPTNPDGSPAGAPVKEGWSQVTNSPSVQDSIAPAMT